MPPLFLSCWPVLLPKSSRPPGCLAYYDYRLADRNSYPADRKSYRCDRISCHYVRYYTGSWFAFLVSRPSSQFADALLFRRIEAHKVHRLPPMSAVFRNFVRHLVKKMSSAGFDFRQFHVAHDRCAMKVGTDGVLLGAWADVVGASRVLDVGCGSGLIALMVAQRTGAHIVGVEVDAAAAVQAAENVSASPWPHRIDIVRADVSDYRPDEQFDHIVANPPFFAEDLLPPDAARAQARHTAGLTFERLLGEVARLLVVGGRFHAIVPASAYDAFAFCAWEQRLYPYRRTDVVTRPGKPVRRVLVSFVEGQERPIQRDELVLCDARGMRSAGFQKLTADFYL